MMMTEPRTLLSEYVMNQIEEVKESENESNDQILDDSGLPSSIGFVKTP